MHFSISMFLHEPVKQIHAFFPRSFRFSTNTVRISFVFGSFRNRPATRVDVLRRTERRVGQDKGKTETAGNHSIRKEEDANGTIRGDVDDGRGRDRARNVRDARYSTCGKGRPKESREVRRLITRRRLSFVVRAPSQPLRTPSTFGQTSLLIVHTRHYIRRPCAYGDRRQLNRVRVL